jgi:integrase
MSEKVPVIPSRTEETDAAYDRRARQIIARIDRELQASQQRSSSPDDLPTWLAAMTASLAHASWRQYKAALVAYTASKAKSEASWQPVFERLVGLEWSKAKSQPRASKLLRTSAKKEKSPRAEQTEELRTRLALHDPTAAAFFLATWTAGLRPGEWASAKFDWIGDRRRLRVQNAKSTNGRSHGENRTLWFDSLDFRYEMAIRTTISAFKDAAIKRTVTSITEQMERAFRAANNALWPTRRRSITPYTLRHVFAARAKSALRPEEVAALMGHANDLTAFHHYGRRGRSNSGDVGPPLPKPDPKDVERVRKARSAALEQLATTKLKQLPTTKTHSNPVVEQTVDANPSFRAA